MSSLPDDDEGTLLQPSAPKRVVSSTTAEPARSDSNVESSVPGRAGTRIGPRSGGDDPHAPTLSAESIASGKQGVGNALPIGSYLGEFELLEVIGEGGFGIVYLATDHSLQRSVALKEYMPSTLAERTSGMQVSSLSPEDEETFRKGLESFVNEARLLAQFDHPSLVKVHRFWEANGTAYMVMPFYQGPTLKQTLREMGLPPDEDWLRKLLEPLTEVLAVIHSQQCYHRDIAPDNILLLSGSNRPLLLDFGAARRVIGDANQALTVILKPGYAPLEQYAEVPGMKQGPWTDVYALAAVVYFAITGKKPPAAVGRLLNDQYVPLGQTPHAARYSAAFLDAVDKALAVRPEQRTQDIHAFRTALGFGAVRGDDAATGFDRGAAPATASAGGRGAAATPASAASSGRAASQASRGGRMVAVAGGAAVLALAGAGWWWFVRTPEPAPAAVATAPAPAAAPAPSPAPAPARSTTFDPAPAPAPQNLAAPAPAAPFSVSGELERIVQQQTPGFTVEARLTKTQLRIDRDELVVSVNSSRDGFFYVLTLAPDGLLVQYFPNLQAPTNRISAGQSLTLPQSARDPRTGRAATALVLTDPPGRGRLLAIVSRYPRDFSALGDKRIAHYAEYPTGAAAESIARAQPAATPLYLGRPVCPAGEPCVDEYGADLVEFSAVR